MFAAALVYVWRSGTQVFLSIFYYLLCKLPNFSSNTISVFLLSHLKLKKTKRGGEKSLGTASYENRRYRWKIIGYRILDIRYFRLFKTNFEEFCSGKVKFFPPFRLLSFLSFLLSSQHKRRFPWLLNHSNLEGSRGYINSHPFEKQLKNIFFHKGKVFFPPFVCALRRWWKMQNFNEFLGRKVPLSIARSRSPLSNKCSQQGTSDGFHVQIDKFSSVCIN